MAPIDSKLVPNLRRVSAHVWSSGRPEGEEAFRALAALGVKTIISVDGERPQVEAAKRAGIRYVHLPFGYSGVPEERALAIAKAMHEVPGPVLLHCHHGLHRGPAAAAIARLSLDGGSVAEALAEMRAAGTDAHYRGLFASIERFVPPSSETLARTSCELPEVAPSTTTVGFMVEIDARFARLRAQKAEEGDFAHETLLLRESFVELGRAQDRGDEWRTKLAAMLDSVAALESEARTGPPSPSALERAKRSCASCHERFRDN